MQGFGCLREGGSQKREHASARRELDKGLRAFRQALMIAGEPTPARDPGQAALDHPSSGQRTKPWRKQCVPLHLGAFGHEQTPFGNGETPHNLHAPAQVQLEPGDQIAAVVTIAPQELDSRKGFLDWLKQGLGSGHGRIGGHR